MQGKTHLMAGMLAGVMITVDPVAVIAGGIGGLLPDLDHPRSMISRRAGVLAAPFWIVTKHRGVLHSGLCWLILAFFAFYLMLTYPEHGIALLAATAGYLTHLALDSLTISGIPLLWPSGRRFSAIPLRTGGVGEAYIAVAIVAAIALRIGMFVGLL